jgi:hypothetical protein
MMNYWDSLEKLIFDNGNNQENPMDPSIKARAAKAIELVKDIIDKNGSRVSGSNGNYESVEYLRNILKETCPIVKLDKFSLSPDSLFSIGKIFTILYVSGLGLLLLDGNIYHLIGLLLMLFGMVFCFSQFILFSDLFDRFFRKVDGTNLIGIIEPRYEVKEQLILVGHHDSSYIYPFHEKYPVLFPIRLFIPILLFILEFITLCLSLFAINAIWVKYVLLFGLVFVIPMFRYISSEAGPGAGDNLIGCAIGIGILQGFNTEKTKLNNTRLLLVLCDGEEIGQKGSRQFVKTNYDNLKKIRTSAINIDSIYDIEDIILLTRDRNGFSKLSTKRNKRLQAIAGDLGYTLRLQGMPPGGGGTDGGQFARKGIETISIIGTPIKAIRREIIIHTTKDIPERIHEEAVACVMEIVSEYIRREELDRGYQ